MRSRLGIGPDDRVVLPQRDAEALGLAEGDGVEVLVSRGAFAVVAPARAAAPAYFGGSLAAISVPEALNFLFSTLKTGVLLLSFAGAAERRAGAPAAAGALRRKSIYFRDGQVVFASSSDRADRLGAVLWRHGLAPLDDLERCARLVASGRPLGQVLVDEGVLTPGRLYDGMTLQVREIVLAAFLESEGEFVFLEGPYDERNAVKLPERTRDLLLEGVRRAEAAAALLELLPDRDGVLRATGRTAGGLGAREARLLAAVDGTRTARQAIEESQLGPFGGLEALARLVEEGLVAGPPRPRPEPAAGEEEVFSVAASAPSEAEAAPRTSPGVSGPFETYRRIFRYVFAALATARAGARERLDSFFDRLPDKQRPLFEGVRVDDEGEVDVARVLLNVSSAGAWKGAAARARALEALEGLLAFMLFEVKNCLPTAEAEQVLREVGRMQVGKA